MSRATDLSSCLAGPGEPLDEHLVGVMEEMRRDPVFDPVARKLARVFGIRPELAMDLLEFTALAHDVGKADVAYKNADKYFPLHEARSADFAFYVLAKAGALRANDLAALDAGNAVITAVALHHYSHKTYNAEKTKTGFKARCRSYAEAFRSWTPRTAEGAALKEVAASTLDVTGYGVYAVVVQNIRRIGGNAKLRSAASALLGLLNKADRTVARRRRHVSGGV